MNKKQYLAQRQTLMNEAQALIDEGKAEEAEAKMKEVTALDEKWEKIAQAQANFDAMNKEPQGMAPYAEKDFANLGGQEEPVNEKDQVMASDTYVNAWAKFLMNKKLSAEEDKAFLMVNEAFTHTKENTSIVIPKTVTRGIWEEAGEMYPFFADIAKTYVNGVLSMIQEDTSTGAAWYDEAEATEDGKETFKEFTLSGCELSRAITVSWKLKEMAIEDFIPYIQRKLAKKMGAAAGYGATHGKGVNEENGKDEPVGVVTALEAEENTPQVVTYTKGTNPTYTNLLAVRALIKTGYSAGVKIYANSKTIWTKLANILDTNKRPIFVPDPTAGGVFRILGMVVKEDDSMKDGEILLSNAAVGYHMNINKEMSVLAEEHIKQRTTDYCAYAIMDGNVVTTKAHALLKEATA